MSAVRRNDRRTSRIKQASPYTRPLKASNEDKQKKSLWNLGGLLGFLNPFGKSTDRVESRPPPPPSDDDEVEISIPEMHPAFQVQLDPGADPEWNLPPTLQQASAELIQQQQEEQQQRALQHPQPPSSPAQPSTASTSPQQAPQTPPRNSLPFPLTPPAQLSSVSRAYSGPLAKNLEPVTRFLVEKAGQPLNEFEAAGIVDYIQRNVQGADKPEPFRFSTSPSRSSSPSLNLGNSNATSSTPSPRKTLTRNPNGVYRWQGAGSSRPRNRYQSPGFGPRPQQSRIKLSPPKTPATTDTKRRRVGDEAESSVPQWTPMPSTSTSTSTVIFPSQNSEPASQSQQPSPSASMTGPDGKTPATLAPPSPVTPKANGTQGTRLRTTGLSTSPAIPSPLRQTWKGNDSPLQPPQPSRPTKAAGYMTELLKEITPVKKPDVSNPYQTASPVKPPPRKPAPKRPRPAVKAAEKPKEKAPQLTAREIIEATVPKGSKRSRPPPELEDSPRVEEASGEEIPIPAINGISSQSSRFPGSSESAIEVEEIVCLDEESPPKKRKTTKSPQPSQPPAAEVIDIDASELPPSSPLVRPTEITEPDESPKVNGKPGSPTTASSLPTANSKTLFGIKSSAPKEPSKLRYSYQVDKVEVVASSATSAPPTAPLPPASSLFTPPTTPVPSLTHPIAGPPKAKLSPQDEALAVNTDDLPKYSFTVKETVYPAGPSSENARKAASEVPVSSLPTFDIKSIPVKDMNGFNWTAAGLKPPTPSTGSKWKCDLCGLENPDSAKEKCTICDAPRPGVAQSEPVSTSPPAPAPPAPPVPPVKAFDWSAAGVAPPKPSGDSWTCSSCMLSNPATATDKCKVCDTPR
ncbi:hypothetical protein EDD17DRAFT_349080 [Pisolithus thermaeus]|nr:hypothetical protein EDD17DRAFT_349080 [Pisolithus thermaeus]